MNIQDLKDKNLIVFETVAGSRAYGTNTPTSDTDIRGVFIQPEEDFFGLERVEQVANESSDIVYYELTRFIELLLKNNPNVLELLAMPEDCIQIKHHLFDLIKPELFLSKKCRGTLGGYAVAQIQKARGLNKKIVNPMGEVRKSILEFCHVLKDSGSMSLEKFLEVNNYKQENCGLVNIAHARDMYALFYSETLGYKGLVSDKEDSQVLLTSIPETEKPVAYMALNMDGYKKYCKDFKDYQEWLKCRNIDRFESTINHGKNYDAKNIMHTFRLLDMAEEIATQGKIIVRRPNREYLLQIRNGEFEYDDLINIAEERLKVIDGLFEKSSLPELPDYHVINSLLITIRKTFYNYRSNIFEYHDVDKYYLDDREDFIERD